MMAYHQKRKPYFAPTVAFRPNLDSALVVPVEVGAYEWADGVWFWIETEAGRVLRNAIAELEDGGA